MAAGGLLGVPNRGHVAEFTAGGALQQAIARPGGRERPRPFAGHCYRAAVWADKMRIAHRTHSFI